MSKLPERLMMFVVSVALLAFGAGIVVAARYTLWVTTPRPADMPAIVVYFVTAVNGILASNLGAVLGISISLYGWRGPKNTMEKLQWLAAGWYVAMLALATVLWGVMGFSEDPAKVVPLLPQLTKNAVGIFIAILAAVLGVQTAITRAGKEPANAAAALPK